MFAGGFSIWHWLVVAVVVLLIFGTKKLRNVGGDLGGAVRDFKKAMRDDEPQPKLQADEVESERVKSASREKTE